MPIKAITTGSGGGATKTWAQVLAKGNTSGGTNPVISATDGLVFGTGTPVAGQLTFGTGTSATQILGPTDKTLRIISGTGTALQLQVNGGGGSQLSLNNGGNAILSADTGGHSVLVEVDAGATQIASFNTAFGLTIISGSATTTLTNVLAIQNANGGTLVGGVISNSVTTAAGTSVNLATAVPAGSQIIGVSYRITTTVTGPTSHLQLQDSAGNVYLSQDTLTAGTTRAGGSFGDAPAAFFNNFYLTSNTFKLVSTATAFTGGVVEVQIYFNTITAPTS